MGWAPRSTAKVVDERVEFVKVCVAQLRPNRAIKRMCRDTWGVSSRTATRYMRLAREKIIAETGKSRGEHVVDVYGFLWSVVQDPNASTPAKLKACDSLCKLLGLYAPVQVVHVDGQGRPLNETQNPADTRDRVEAILARYGAEPTSLAVAG